MKLIWAAAGLTGLMAAAGIAQADRGGHGYGGEGGHGGGHGRMMMMEQFTERYDANNDGKISQEEIDTNRTATLERNDADKDGSLSLAEFEKVWMEANRQRMVREFQRFDTDGDAKVTLEEYRKPLADMVARADRNGDGVLSRDDRGRGDGMRRMHRWQRGDGEGHGRGQGGGMMQDEAPAEDNQ
jgi:Ca2+-binding EF-hand superfamily protein